MERTYSLSLRSAQAWLLAGLFVVGNIALPQLCHLVPQGGLILLPIYFFTLIGAYKYGFGVGVVTAVLSPVINSLLFGMPAAAMLPIILIKSLLLAGAAALMASRTGRVTLLSLVAVVLGYQVVGSLAEWAITGSLVAAVQDFRLGLPGMALQVLGGYAVIKYLLKK
ncbi:MAG: ECF transporter S component [Tidjanibacter sp.]|nr:ECF transporter S component [Tidjanibacter sp.]MBR7102416.1 ECF transporter S component [Tidjanibacter sp.]